MRAVALAWGGDEAAVTAQKDIKEAFGHG